MQTSVTIQLGELLFQVFEFGEIVVDDIGLVCVRLQVILVVILGAKERLERYDFRDDFPGIDLSGIELLDIGRGDPMLFLI